MKSMCVVCPNIEPFKLKLKDGIYTGVCPRCGSEKMVFIPQEMKSKAKKQ